MPKIVCIGRNYLEHIKELNNAIPEQAVIFCKPDSAISEILISQVNGEPCHYEAELCFKVLQGKLAQAAIGIDLTLRDTQSKLKAKGLPWERAKAFDGSATFSPFVDIDSTDDFSFTLHVDGELRQQGNSQLMMLTPEQILTEIQSFMTLQDGDIIMTGTPSGVGKLHKSSLYQVQLQQSNQLLIEHSWEAQ